ncbi:MAG TPA: PIN domain nuclease [Cytophagales bacterium]|nr:PIN domain nuclease [Cytophagales bacterium]HAP64767.1 PIN domain nuclease [Cytophagales bacterium]
MNLLLDTHVAIWFVTEDKKLSASTKAFIENHEGKVWVSIASYWEIGIKHSLNKLLLKRDLNEIFNIISDSGLELLSITPLHILQNIQLPFHHRDPFDRMLVAQAQCDNLTLVSKDEWIRNYEVDLFWI